MHPRIVLSIGAFFLAISSTLVNYTLLSYLSPMVSGIYAGLVVSVGAIIAIVCFPFLPTIVTRMGAQRLALFIGFAEMIILFGLAATPSIFVGALLIACTLALQPLLFYELDLLLEATVGDSGSTGRVRTLFLTASNIGALTAPLLLGVLLDGTNNYLYTFFAAGVALVPFVILFASRQLPNGKPPQFYHVRDTLVHIIRHRDLAAVTFGHFLLYLFYIWAPFYIPIYLHDILGFSWATLGWMFSIMLIPYVFLEYPAGWVADKILGDRDLMLAGFLIAGTALASLSTLSPTSSPLLILGILIATRIGAALIESMTEGHFFRRVSEQDITSISVFRGVWPVASLIAPIVASMTLYFGTYQLFFVLVGGFIAIAGTTAALLIRDDH